MCLGCGGPSGRSPAIYADPIFPSMVAAFNRITSPMGKELGRNLSFLTRVRETREKNRGLSDWYFGCLNYQRIDSAPIAASDSLAVVKGLHRKPTGVPDALSEASKIAASLWQDV